MEALGRGRPAARMSPPISLAPAAPPLPAVRLLSVALPPSTVTMKMKMNTGRPLFVDLA